MKAKAKTWTSMRPADYILGPGGARQKNPGFAWVNRHYSVFAYERPDGSVVLSIKPKEGARHDWREFQRIKNEIVGPDREAVELYPAEDRLVDTANQFFLYVAPPGMRWPFGYAHREVSTALVTERNTQRAFGSRDAPEDVIRDPEVLARGPHVKPWVIPPWAAMQRSWDEDAAEIAKQQQQAAEEVERAG